MAIARNHLAAQKPPALIPKLTLARIAAADQRDQHRSQMKAGVTSTRFPDSEREQCAADRRTREGSNASIVLRAFAAVSSSGVRARSGRRAASAA